MNQETENLLPEPERTPAAYRRDLHRARLVIGQLRDEALASGEPFQVADLALDATALDELWDGLDRVDTHFWKDESFRRYMEPGRRRWGSAPSALGGSSGGADRRSGCLWRRQAWQIRLCYIQEASGDSGNGLFWICRHQ